METVKFVKELDAKGMTFVPFDNVLQFCELCKVLGIIVCGGAFARDMSGQWFYV